MATQTIDQPVPLNEDTPRGFAFALAAYLMWGFLPLYLKLVQHIPSAEVVAHRIIWSVPIAAVLLLWLRRTSDIRAAFRSPRTLAMSALAAAILTVNWGIYVWAIAVDRTLEAALGYYINPLLSIFLGAVVLGERLNRIQLVAIGFAVLAVAVLTYETGGLPWVSLGLAGSWGVYALLKKTMAVGPAQGFFLEVLVLAPPALGYIVWLQSNGEGHFNLSTPHDIWLLIGTGFATAVPLITYANGAKLLRLSTIGIMQYIAPTMVFLIAVFVFHEPFDTSRAIAFGLIWVGLILYTSSMLKRRQPISRA